MNDLLIDRLKKLAASKTWEECSEKDGDEFFDPNDYAGGNIDDAYAGGKEDGGIELAREVLAAMDIKW